MIYVSTNMYSPEHVMDVIKIVDHFNGHIGIELFPMFHDLRYEPILQKNLKILKKYKYTFHGPYYHVEHSASKGTTQYEESMLHFKKTLTYANLLEPSYIVYHLNNCKIWNREEMLRHSIRNLDVLSSLSRIPLVIENVGIEYLDNNLFELDEFIDFCRGRKENVLIDIGHANANDWDLEVVIENLKDKIVSYHLHSNDGIHDSHDRIFENTPDMTSFMEFYRKYTPDADLVIEYSMKYQGKEDLVIEDIEKLQEFL